jgi:hypothetical protein
MQDPCGRGFRRDEHLPGSTEVDNHRAFGNGEGNRDAALGGRRQRVGNGFSFVCGTLGLDCACPSKQRACRQGWNSSCQTECRRSLEQFSSIHNVLSRLFYDAFCLNFLSIRMHGLSLCIALKKEIKHARAFVCERSWLKLVLLCRDAGDRHLAAGLNGHRSTGHVHRQPWKTSARQRCSSLGNGAPECAVARGVLF